MTLPAAPERTADTPKRLKVSHIGAPAVFALEQALKHVNDAFCEDDSFAGVYIVGSCLERPDWRDVDVRLIMEDAAFERLFPAVEMHSGAWEFDPRWCLMTVAISKWLSAETGLPIDFQFQPMTHANKHHEGPRHAAGLRISRRAASTTKEG